MVIAGLAATPFSDVVAVYSIKEDTWITSRATKDDLEAPFQRCVMGLKVFGNKDPCQIDGTQLSLMLSGLEWAYFELCRYLFANRDDICARTNFGTYDKLMAKLDQKEVEYFEKPRTNSITLGPLGSYVDLSIGRGNLASPRGKDIAKKGSHSLEGGQGRTALSQQRRLFGCSIPERFESGKVKATGHLVVTTLAQTLDVFAPVVSQPCQFTYALMRYAQPYAGGT